METVNTRGHLPGTYGGTAHVRLDVSLATRGKNGKLSPECREITGQNSLPAPGEKNAAHGEQGERPGKSSAGTRHTDSELRARVLRAASRPGAARAHSHGRPSRHSAGSRLPHGLRRRKARAHLLTFSHHHFLIWRHSSRTAKGEDERTPWCHVSCSSKEERRWKMTDKTLSVLQPTLRTAPRSRAGFLVATGKSPPVSGPRPSCRHPSRLTQEVQCHNPAASWLPNSPG